MDLCSLEGMEMDDTLETLLGAEDMRRKLTVARNTLADLQETLQQERDERIRLEERLKLAERRVPCTMEARPVGHYTFKNHLRTQPGEVVDEDAFAVTLVAVAGSNNDWSCYMGRAGQRPAEIAAHGDRVPVRHADIFTHVMQLRDYYY